MDAGAARHHREDPGPVKGVGAPPREASDGIEGRLNAPLSEAAARELGRDVQASPVSHGLARPLSWPNRMVDAFEEIVAGVALLIVVGSVSWGGYPAMSRGSLRPGLVRWRSWPLPGSSFSVRRPASRAACTQHRHARNPPAGSPRARCEPVRAPLRDRFLRVHGLPPASFFRTRPVTDPTPVLRLPYTVVYGPVTLGFALMLARHLGVPLALPLGLVARAAHDHLDPGRHHAGALRAQRSDRVRDRHGALSFFFLETVPTARNFVPEVVERQQILSGSLAVPFWCSWGHSSMRPA